MSLSSNSTKVFLLGAVGAIAITCQISAAMTIDRSQADQGTVLSALERQCLFGQLQAEKCQPAIERLVERAGYTKGAGEQLRFYNAHCKEIDKSSNYTALGNKNGFGKGGGLAFDAKTSVRTRIDDAGGCTILIGEYAQGYELFYTNDRMSECTRRTTIEPAGRYLVSTSELVSCKKEKYLKSENRVIRKQIGLLRQGRKVNADYSIPEIIIPRTQK